MSNEVVACLGPIPEAEAGTNWASLATRLRQIGLTCEFTLARQEQSNLYPEAQRSDWLQHSYANDPSPAAIALRLLAFEMPIPESQCITALEQPLFAQLCNQGFLIKRNDGWVCPFEFELVNDLYLFSDRTGHRQDTVMGFGPTTQALVAASFPPQNIGAALDLGCGGGVLSLLLSRVAKSVVGTDINPRAIALARLNAAINDISNVTFLEGDLYAPVAGQRFDFLVCQPPFLGRLPSQEQIRYLHGGARGDELFHRIMAEMPAFLAPGGLGMVLVDLAIDDPSQPTASIPESSQVKTTVLLDARPISLQMHASSYMANALLLTGSNLWNQTASLVDHLSSCGMQELRQALVVVEAVPSDARAADTKASSTQPVTAVQHFDVPPGNKPLMRRECIDQLLASSRLQAQPWKLWLPLQLRIAPGTQWQQSGPLPSDTEPTKWTLIPGGESLLANPIVGDGLLQLLQSVHESENVESALAELVPEEQPLEAFQQSAIQALGQMVLHGVLVVT